MSFLSIEATPITELAGWMQEKDRAKLGYMPNYSVLFALHPEAYQAWKGLIESIAGAMDTRRYELATLGAARSLRSSYCSLAHGKILAEEILTPEAVTDLVIDPSAAPIEAEEKAVFEFAGKVADDATAIIPADIDRLRSHGLSDHEIFEVVLAAAARCFFSKVLDATGTLPDHEYAETLDPELLAALTVGGRPLAH